MENLAHSLENIEYAYICTKMSSRESVDQNCSFNAKDEDHKRGFSRFQNCALKGDRASALHGAKYIFGMSDDDAEKFYSILMILIKYNPEDVLRIYEMQKRICKR